MIDPGKCFPFEVQNQGNERYHAQFLVPMDLPYFDGHFPGSPVLPAVAIVDACQEFLRRALAQPQLKLHQIKMAKFTGLVTPGLHVALDFQRQNDEWTAEWRDLQQNQLLASLRLQV